MARKRGGLAGVWDRNKGVIKTIAPIAAGFIPGVGPLVAAGLGAAMGGLDREGKSGIGLDVGGAVKGGISGYGAGMAGAGIGSGVKGLLTGAKEGVGSALSGAAQGAKSGMGTYNQQGVGRLFSSGAAPSASMTANTTTQPFVGVGAPTGFSVPASKASAASRVGDLLTGKYAPLVMSTAGKGIDAYTSSRAQNAQYDAQMAADHDARIRDMFTDPRVTGERAAAAEKEQERFLYESMMAGQAQKTAEEQRRLEESRSANLASERNADEQDKLQELRNMLQAKQQQSVADIEAKRQSIEDEKYLREEERNKMLYDLLSGKGRSAAPRSYYGG